MLSGLKNDDVAGCISKMSMSVYIIYYILHTKEMEMDYWSSCSFSEVVLVLHQNY